METLNNDELQHKKTITEMRAEKIPEKVRKNFGTEEDFIEANRIAMKINILIDSLPFEKQGKVSKKFLELLNNSKDIYFYKELHDEILEEKKDYEQPKQEKGDTIIQPDHNNAITRRTLYVKGELKDIQVQYSNNPDRLKINFGARWEFIDKANWFKIQEESEKIEDLEKELKNKN